MSEHDPKLGTALDGLDESKRETLTRLVRGSAFVAPVVASFAMQGMSIRPAHAQPGSSSNSTVSDLRLKRGVERVGTHASGCGIYRFSYLWSDERYVGVIAQEVADLVPDAVRAGPAGYLAVDYGMLGMQMTRESSP
jgi:hypothetical protein